MSFRYEIDKDNTVRAWNDATPNENDAPFLLQPDWPNGTAWANKDEAESWVKALIESLENPTSEFLAGDGPDQPLVPRPAAEPAPAEETPAE